MLMTCQLQGLKTGLFNLCKGVWAFSPLLRSNIVDLKAKKELAMKCLFD